MSRHLSGDSELPKTCFDGWDSACILLEYYFVIRIVLCSSSSEHRRRFPGPIHLRAFE